MCPHPSRICLENGLGQPHRRAWLVAAICALGAAGCEEETRNVGKRPETRALGQTGVAGDLDEQRPAPAQAQAPAKPPGPIIGQRTTEIRNAAPELQKGNAKVASTKIVKRDPITIVGNAYVSIIGRTSVLNIQHAMDLYKATNDRYPKDYDEFMTEIIKANNIALPRLPPYQEYGYDEKEHKLILLEYEDRK